MSDQKVEETLIVNSPSLEFFLSFLSVLILSFRIWDISSLTRLIIKIHFLVDGTPWTRLSFLTVVLPSRRRSHLQLGYSSPFSFSFEEWLVPSLSHLAKKRRRRGFFCETFIMYIQSPRFFLCVAYEMSCQSPIGLVTSRAGKWMAINILMGIHATRVIYLYAYVQHTLNINGSSGCEMWPPYAQSQSHSYYESFIHYDVRIIRLPRRSLISCIIIFTHTKVIGKSHTAFVIARSSFRILTEPINKRQSFWFFDPLAFLGGPWFSKAHWMAIQGGKIFSIFFSIFVP